ncbi:hypothetical protein IJZ97_00075 [bacterium]|nr:hypothetical protein [bacterium]
MVDFNEKIPTGLPKLPEDYWGGKNAENNVLTTPEINIFDKNLNVSLEDISIFKKLKDH